MVELFLFLKRHIYIRVKKTITFFLKILANIGRDIQNLVYFRPIKGQRKPHQYQTYYYLIRFWH
jgi:hypothetical protein